MGVFLRALSPETAGKDSRGVYFFMSYPLSWCARTPEHNMPLRRTEKPTMRRSFQTFVRVFWTDKPRFTPASRTNKGIQGFGPGVVYLGQKKAPNERGREGIFKGLCGFGL